MNPKRIFWILTFILLFSLVLGQVVFAQGSSSGALSIIDSIKKITIGEKGLVDFYLDNSGLIDFFIYLAFFLPIAQFGLRKMSSEGMHKALPISIGLAMAIGAAVLGNANGLVLAQAAGPLAFALAVVGISYMLSEVFRGFGASFKFSICASYSLVGLLLSPFLSVLTASEFSSGNHPLSETLGLVTGILYIAWFAALGYVIWHIFSHFRSKSSSESP